MLQIDQREAYGHANRKVRKLEAAGMVNNDYRSYLLQLWRVEDDGGCWRARLEDVQTGRRHGFASLERLVEFLQSLGQDEPEAGKSEED